MSILVYNKKSSYAAFDINTIPFGSAVFNPKEKEMCFMPAPGVIKPLDSEAVLNGEVYEKFVDAIAAINGEAIIELMNDVILAKPIMIPVDAKVILDLNGHSIAAAPEMSYNGGMITIPHGASLIVEGDGEICGNANVYAPFQMTHKDFADDSKLASLTINDGHFIGQYYVVCGNGNKGRGNSEVIINGGLLETKAVDDGAVIFNPQENSSVAINNGTLIGKGSGVEMRSGDLIINGGIIESTATSVSVSPNGNGVTAVGSAIAVCQHTTKNPINVIINDGVMKGHHALYQANPQKNDAEAVKLVSMTVNGGKFIGKTMSVYSENKEYFIKGGSFTPNADAKYFVK